MNRATYLLCGIPLLLSAAVALADERPLPAFPGAEGFGATAKGGRGGRVIKVTNLNAKGPGSFQEACSAEGPRIVVFEVSGVIRGTVRITQPNITIAGQTAPGAGITIEGSLTGSGVNDSIIRFLRARGGGDSIGLMSSENLVLDHLSASWGTDENMGLSTCGELTVQWCSSEESQIVWEGSQHYGLIHNYGMILGYVPTPVTLHHTLFAQHSLRAPLVGLDLDYRNNVVYNMTSGVQWHPRSFNRRAKGERFRFNAVGNYYKAGPGAPHFPRGPLPAKYSKPGVRCALPFFSTKNAHMYADGNYVDYRGGYVTLAGRAAEPWKTPAVTTHTAEEAYDLVLAHAGCLPRDAVSRRIIRETRTGTGSWGKLVPKGGLMAGLTPAAPPKDADDDGMPDEWEAKHKLDPADPKDANGVVPAGASADDRHAGYTWIEFYINECADRLIAAALAEARREKRSGEALIAPKPPDVSRTSLPRTWSVRDAYAPGLRGVKSHDVAALVKVLETDTKKRRYYAVRALGALGAEAVEAVPALLRRIAAITAERRAAGKGMNLTVTRHLTTALAGIGEPAAPLLLKALDDKEPWTRACAAQALSLIIPGGEAYATALLARTRDADGDVRADALCALNKMGCAGKPFVDAHVKAMADANPRARRMAAEALGKAGAEAARAVPALIQGLADADEVNTRFASAWALGQVGPTAIQAAPALVAALGDADRRVRWHAAETLASLGKEVAHALIVGLLYESPLVRFGCATVLGRLGTQAVPNAVAGLTQRLSDQSPEVRVAAAHALAGSADAQAALVKALADEAWPVRWAAAKSLGEGSVAEADVAAALTTALKDDRKEVRDAAAQALRKAGR